MRKYSPNRHGGICISPYTVAGGYNIINHIHCRSRYHRRSKKPKKMCPTTLRPGNIAGRVWVHSLRLAARLARCIHAKTWHLFRRVVNYVVDR